ncbi:diguanylate phosphodiesterase [Paenibacillus albidus]|uniref:Diguanylate phosphodiesterase n=1 Tax=Paenibacillus albidus TaxID=2041023 RepID=A0A917FS94_9BACL|nr:ABC transporter substrate-binding protein [Paenibacillus albidus]GGG03662.1 diguanylate phosphodiesterase [Paenibacillus albidus]
MKTLKKSFTVGLSSLTVFAVILSGCGGGKAQSDGAANPSASTANPSAAAGGTSNKMEGGTVRVAMSTEPDNLDPYLSAATDTNAMMDNVFDGLFEVGEAGTLTPAIAESYEVSEDGLKYTFHLRQEVKFHDGSDLTSADVHSSYAKLAGLDGKEPLSSKFSAVQSVETPDEYTVVVTLKTVDAAFLSANIAAIVPENYEQQSTKPIGAGPFKFTEYQSGQKLVLEKNEQFYDKDRAPVLDRVEFQFMPDQNSAVLALQSGNIDMVPGVSAQGAAQLGDTFNLVTGPQNMVQLMALNNTVAPLDNEKVRQAINYTIDKDVIIQTVAEGQGTKLGSNMSPAMAMFYQEGLENYYTPDLEKAKKLLSEAGYAQGFDLAITVPSNYQMHVDTAQVIAEQLKPIGIQVSIKQIEWSSWLENVYGNGEYEATIIGLTGKIDPNEVLGRYESTYKKNFYHYKNNAYDALLKQARTEMNEEKRSKLYKEAQKMLTEQAVAVYIMDPSRTTAMAGNLEGFKIYPVQKFDFAEMYYTQK